MKPFIIKDSCNNPYLNHMPPLAREVFFQLRYKHGLDIQIESIDNLDELKRVEVVSNYLLLDCELRYTELEQALDYLLESSWKKILFIGPERTRDSKDLIYLPFSYTDKFNILNNRLDLPDFEFPREFRSSFMGGQTSGERARLSDWVEPRGIRYDHNYYKCDSLIRFNKSYGLRYREATFNQYLWSLDNSEAVISLPGVVVDCFRHYEAASRGCRLITTEIPKVDIGLPKEAWIKVDINLNDIEEVILGIEPDLELRKFIHNYVEMELNPQSIIDRILNLI